MLGRKRGLISGGVFSMIMLDLFCGLGGASQPFVEHEDWTVIRVDNEPLLEPHVPGLCVADVCDVLDRGRWWQPHMKVDLLWASPPCTEFSTANPNRNPDQGIPLVEKAIEIIDLVKPTCWIIENVRGSINHLQPILGAPRLILGPYVFWGNFPLFWVDMDGYSKMTDDPWSDDPLRSQKRAFVPAPIGEALLEALNQQTTLERWMPES